MPPKRVLYVEDNFQNRRLVKKILNAKGYEVLEADDGLQGIAMAERERPDLILMDINMPGLDGMEATALLKNNPDLKRIPVIALTANAMRGDREKIMAAGCDEYLQKPINNAKLFEALQRFLGSGDSASKPAAASAPATPSTATATQEMLQAPSIPTESLVQNDQKPTPEIAAQPSE